jgi:hypothetical protein
MDFDKIRASFKKDVLTVDIPKKDEYVSYREIPVSGDSSNVKVLEENHNEPKNIFKNIKLGISNLFKSSA